MAVHSCVADYLERLPAGLASYPDCRAKGAMLRDLLHSRPLDADAPELHDELRSFVRTPPAVSSWMPETAYVALTMTIYGKYFGGSDIARFTQWICDLNVTMFRTPLYRILFVLMSPERLLFGIAKRWNTFHLGSSLTVLERGANAVLLELEYPPHLFSEAMAHAFAGSATAAVQVAGGRNAASHLESVTPTHARYWMRWSAS